MIDRFNAASNDERDALEWMDKAQTDKTGAKCSGDHSLEDSAGNEYEIYGFDKP